MSVMRETLKKVGASSVSLDDPGGSSASPTERDAKEPALIKKGESDMKTKILVSLGVIIFMLVLLNTTTVFYFYRQYNSNIDVINQETGITRAKVEDLENMTEAISAQLKSYEQGILTLESRVSSNETNTNDLAERIQGTKAAIDDWQKRLESALALVAEIRDGTEKLVLDVDEIKKLNASVDLGKIDVPKGASKGANSKRK